MLVKSNMSSDTCKWRTILQERLTQGSKVWVRGKVRGRLEWWPASKPFCTSVISIYKIRKLTVNLQSQDLCHWDRCRTPPWRTWPPTRQGWSPRHRWTYCCCCRRSRRLLWPSNKVNHKIDNQCIKVYWCKNWLSSCRRYLIHSSNRYKHSILESDMLVYKIQPIINE